MRLPLLGPALATVVFSVGAVGCGHSGRPAANGGERVGPASAEVGDDGFALALHDLLLTDRASPDRAVRLGAIESRQLARAAVRFKAHDTGRGVAAVTGALYLVHSGEATDRMFSGPGGSGVDALR